MSAGCFCSLRSNRCFVMDGDQREMTIDDPYLTVVSVYQTLYQGSNPGTARSLEVPVLDQGNHRIG
ncbi:MAG: hypothetical protein Kow0063_19410 [Anaerolineae bacterium]